MKKETNKAVIPTERGLLSNDGTANSIPINIAMNVQFLNESLKASIEIKEASTLISIKKGDIPSKPTLQELIKALNDDPKTMFIGTALESVVKLLDSLKLDISAIKVIIEKFELEYETFDDTKKESTFTYDIKVTLKSSAEIMKLGPIKLIDISVAISNNTVDNAPQIIIAN